MTDKDKQIHNLKFELRQQRLRCEELEEKLKHIDETINNILKTQLVTILTTAVGVLFKEKEDKK